MYMRRPVKDKRKKAFSEPSTWPEFGFTHRPDWWGFAGVIELGIYRYEKVELEEDEEGAGGSDQGAEEPTTEDGEKHVEEQF
jgi:hypothetical protein